MSHMIETMAYSGQVPWHGLGMEVDNKQTTKQMLKASGLNWQVNKEEIKTKSGIILPDNFAVVRDTDKKPLSICGKKYIPIQNDEAMDFFHKFVKAGKMNMETAGSLDGGKRIWALAKMKNSDFALKGDDKIESFLLFCNSHVPGSKMLIMYTPIRVVCHNTLTYALRAMDTSKGIFKMSHLREFDEDVKAQAELTLGLAGQHAESFKAAAKYLTSKRATPGKVDQYFSDLFQAGVKADEETMNRTIVKLKEVHALQPGANLSEGSWWQAFNAVTYYADHHAGRAGSDEDAVSRRMRNTWFGVMARKKQVALQFAMKYAKESRAA